MPLSARSRWEFLGIVQTGGGPASNWTREHKQKCSESQETSTTQGGQKWPVWTMVSEVVHFRRFIQTQSNLFQLLFKSFFSSFYKYNFQLVTLKENLKFLKGASEQCPFLAAVFNHSLQWVSLSHCNTTYCQGVHNECLRCRKQM